MFEVRDAFLQQGAAQVPSKTVAETVAPATADTRALAQEGDASGT